MKYGLHLFTSPTRTQSPFRPVNDSPQFRKFCWSLALLLMGISSLSWGQCFNTNMASPVNSSMTFGPAEVGDFNGDGKTDIATISYTTGAASVPLNNGYGRFRTDTSFAQNGDANGGLATGDFNKDGNTDLVVTNYSNTVSILLNNGNRGFARAVKFGVGRAPNSVAVSDFNADGKLDLVTANQSSQNVSLLLGDGNGGFGVATNFSISDSDPTWVRVGDFNGDSKPDLAVVNFHKNSVSVLLNRGNGEFGTATTFIVGRFPNSAEVGDFNADGKLDLVVADGGDEQLHILLNDGNGVFTLSSSFSVNNLAPFFVVVGDFNADNKTDLAVPGTNAVVIITNDNNRFEKATSFGTGNNPQHIVTSDFNADGKPDLAMIRSGNRSGQRVSTLLSCTIPPNPTTNASQTATVGIPFSQTANAFTQAETPNSLTYSASIFPANGLTFDASTRIISGTPSTTGVTTVTVTATDPVGLRASTNFTITVLDPIILAVDEPIDIGLTISPNPTTDVVQVSLTDTYRGVAVITLTDAAGKVLQTYSFPGTGVSQQHTVSTRDLPPGVYYLTVQQGEQRMTEKVLKY